MNYAFGAGSASGASERVPMSWFEWPLLVYFMLHLFPPVRGPWGNACLVLGTVGVVWECRKGSCRPLQHFSRPLFYGLILLGVFFAASLAQAPSPLLAESWHRFSSHFLKGCGFALILFLYLRSDARARRLLLAGMFACTFMLLHLLLDTVRDVLTTGKLPFQRDYLFWMTFFFPFALAIFLAGSRWRWLALLSAAGVIAAAVMTGFRGAMLTLLLMLLIFSVFGRLWHLIALGLGLAVSGVAALLVWFPSQGTYALSKLQQVDSSNRVAGHWLPTWDMSWDSPWLGHGYGHEVFRHHYDLQIDSHPAWTPMWSEELGRLPSAPHSILLETFFAAGLPAVIAYLLLVAAVLSALAIPVWRQRQELRDDPWLLLALAVLTAFVGNYVVFFQFESPNWRTLPIAIAIAAACQQALEARGRIPSGVVPNKAS